jgi:predicted dehydrogenase
MPGRAVNTVKWGLVGAGDIAQKRVAPALRDSARSELVAIARARADLAESFARTFGARRWYGHWEELVADPEVDAVYLATPVHLHAAQATAAAEAGKHVLCEKPMAMDVRQCDRMLAACRASHVRLGVAYYRRFYPAVARVRQIVESGEIGTPVLAQIEAFEWFNPAPDQPRAWLVKKAAAAGGPMFDFGCHRLEVLVNILGPVRHASGLVANVMFNREVEDTAAALLQFERGACATLAVTHAAAEPRDTLKIFGTRGSIDIAELNKGDLLIRTGSQERRESHPPAPNLHQPLVDDFVEAVLTDREPAVTGEVGRMVAQIEDQVYGSAHRTSDALG